MSHFLKMLVPLQIHLWIAKRNMRTSKETLVHSAWNRHVVLLIVTPWGETNIQTNPEIIR